MGPKIPRGGQHRRVKVTSPVELSSGWFPGSDQGPSCTKCGQSMKLHFADPTLSFELLRPLIRASGSAHPFSVRLPFPHCLSEAVAPGGSRWTRTLRQATAYSRLMTYVGYLTAFVGDTVA